MSVLYQVPLIKTESNEESDELENSSALVLVRSKKAKQVLGQISMNQQQQQQPVAKKRRVSDGASTKVKPPPAVAVARRNARERNRVKQVNNGFSMLREHIPKEIAETFEQAGRGSAKKLSKVETLRMAVEYIRSLERMLAFDTSNDSESSSPGGCLFNSTAFSNMSSMSEASLPATPPPESQQPFFYALKPHGGVLETQITIVGGQQYVRIPGTNTFQLVTHDLFENEENVQPGGDEYSTTTTIQIHPPTDDFGHLAMGTSAISAKTPAGSISPYSGHSSLSPAPSHAAALNDNIGHGVIMDEAQGQLACLAGGDQKLPYGNESLMLPCAASEASHYDNVILKQEIVDDEAMFDDSSLSNEHMIDAMQWWEQQQQQLAQHQSP